MKSGSQKIGLFFGSFNPIHIGHLILANYFVEFTDLKEAWFVISPQNPFKTKESLLADHHRYYMANLAVEDNARLRVSDIEFKMPQPSYTIDTLTYLQEKYPAHEFVLLMGADQMSGFSRWKNYEQILEYFQIYLYPRPGATLGEFKDHPRITMVEGPLLEISSSFIRNAIKDKKDVRYWLPEPVYRYIQEMHFYQH
ncbi:MAG: nicotinate (nicotinamide) nucleotide adenylyltransferase [Bacteroidota bacterium]